MNRPVMLLVAVSSIGLAGSFQVPPVATTEAQLVRISFAVESYRADCAEFPSGLNELVVATDAAKNCWNGPYIGAKSSVDVWGSYLNYSVASDKKNFSLKSLGADKKLGTTDDIVFGDADKKWRALYESTSRTSRFGLLAASILIVCATATAVIGFVRRAGQQKKGRI